MMWHHTMCGLCISINIVYSFFLMHSYASLHNKKTQINKQTTNSARKLMFHFNATHLIRWMLVVGMHLVFFKNLFEMANKAVRKSKLKFQSIFNILWCLSCSASHWLDHNLRTFSDTQQQHHCWSMILYVLQISTY